MNSKIVDRKIPIYEDSHGYFPFEYFVDFLKFLRENNDIIKIITYDDLPWDGDYNYVSNYPQEYRNWRNQLKNGIRDDQKIYVLLQHDVDSAPERTMAILREEERLGIPSNVMIFNRRINRRHLQETGELIYTDYKLDYDYLRQLQEKSGFVIGYHSNAFEQVLFEKKRALEIFENDINALRKYFNVRYFSPHGGTRSPEGSSNNILPIPESLKYSIRWIHNRKNVCVDGEYSDGGINSPKRNPAKRDLRDFVRKWERGKRYRILIHPQYYHTPWKLSPRLTGTPWYDNLLNFYASKKNGTAWEGVHLNISQKSVNSKISSFIFLLKKIIKRYLC
jgi:hypothetical protein